MKRLVLSTVAFVLAASTAAVAGVHTVGGGTPNTGNSYPFYGPIPAMRWQTMWFRSELNETGAVTKIEWQIWTSAGAGGTYSNCDILLCQTGFSYITANFNNNYGGNTPTNVFTGAYVLPARFANEWVTIAEPHNFTFNNRDNLLIEISWRGGTAGSNFFRVRTTGSPPFPGRVYNSSSKTATTGSTQSNYHHYGRITIGYIGAAPTSLGRIKGLYN